MASTHPLVERFREGGVPEPLKSAAARGALPVPPEDLLEILALLAPVADAAMQQDIVQTVAGITDDVLIASATAADTSPGLLDFLARACFRRPAVLERVLVNAATPDATVQLMAQHASESVLDLLSLNQVRLARSPGILQSMLQNPRMTNSIRRRLKEIWELQQREAARPTPAAAAAPPAEAPAPEAPPPAVQAPEAAAPVAAPEAAAPPAVPAAPPLGDEPAVVLPDLGDLADLDELALSDVEAKILEELKHDDASEEELRLAKKLLTMTIPEKIQLAQFGPREARAILIRDGSKLVQEAVIKSPKITDNEIEKIANMRSIGEDILRMIGNDRESTKNYTVCLNLVRNPKCPQMLSIQLMQKLQNRDLQFIQKDKNIPDMIRRQAGLLLQKRQPAAKK